MRPHYQRTPISLAEVVDKFSPRIRGESPTCDHVAMLGIMPVGKLQCYRNIDYPDYAAAVGLDGGISIDLFIAQPGLLGLGFGRSMLRAYIHTVAFALFPGEHAYICHDLTNVAARKCSVAAGFQPLRHVEEDGVPSELLVIWRPGP